MEYLQFSRTVQIISTVVLAFFLWTFGGVFDIAYAVKTDQRLADSAQRVRSQQSTSGAQQPTSQRPEKKLGKDIEELGNVLNDTKTDFDTKKQKVSAKKADIDADDIAIKKQFKETEDKIKDLPDVIKQRHRDFVKKYDNNLTTHRTNLEDIDKAKTQAEKDLALKKAKDFLEKVKPSGKHKPLDPSKLPHRTEEPVFKEPRTRPEQFQKENEQRVAGASERSKSILVASNGSLKGLLFPDSRFSIHDSQTQNSELTTQNYLQLALANPPTNDDLAETIEVQFTDAIKAKAAELGYKPVQIYNWVRNSIEYVPTYGSIQGADMCLQTKQCNDMDTSSLLIALLRASGIHARYVYGTIEVPVEKVKNWVGGFTDSTAALNLMATGGIPIGGLTEGGKIVTAQKEHIWVEAYINYFPSRGARHKNGKGDTWIPLDASFKQNDFRQGIDFSAAVPFDSTALTSSLVNSATINQAEGWITGIDGSLATTAVADYRGRIEAYMTQSVQNASVENVVGSTRIIKQEFSMLMGTLPYKTVAKGASYSAIPDSLRHKLGFMIVSVLVALFFGFWLGLFITILLGFAVVVAQNAIDKNYEVSFKDVALYLASVITWTSLGAAFAPLLAAGPAGWVLLAMLIVIAVGQDFLIMHSSREPDFLYARLSPLLNETSS